MTIEPSFDTVTLRKTLMKLAPQQRLAFGLSCCERLYPNYVVFAVREGWGDPITLRSALDFAWDALLNKPNNKEDVHKLKKKVENAEPSTDDFETILASSALDAAATTGMVLKLLEVDDPNIVVEIASLARDTVDMYIQAIDHLVPSDTALDRKIQEHPLMQAELRRQRDDLLILSRTPWTPKEAQRLKAAWCNPDLSNIGLSPTQ